MALVSLALAKEELDIPSANTDEDARITKFVAAASEYVENQCNRVFSQATYTQYFDGTDSRYLLLRQFPVTSITSLHLDDAWTFGAGSLIPAADYRIDREVMAVRRCANFHYVSALAVKAVYVAGYATIPVDIQQAVLELVLWLYYGRNDRRKGLTARSKLGENVAFTDGIPPQVEALVANHTRDAYIASQLAGFPPDMIKAMIAGAANGGKAKG